MHRLDRTLASVLDALKDAINDSLLASERVNESMGFLEKLGHPVTIAVDIAVLPPKEGFRPQQGTAAIVRLDRLGR